MPAASESSSGKPIRDKRGVEASASNAPSGKRTVSRGLGGEVSAAPSIAALRGEVRPRILVINPGSTSTKVALFLGPEKTAEASVEHGTEDLAAFERLLDQLFFREAVIRRFLREKGCVERNLDAVVGRGGLLRPLEGGVYTVGPDLLSDLRSGRYGEHASNLGAPLAREIADRSDCPAFIVDPVVVDELDDAARLSGHPDLPRRSVFHALNQRSVARLTARRLGKAYEDCRFIVVHMGGGITVGAHVGGKVIDVNNGLDGDGPFTPERSGTLPVGQVVSLCFHSGKSESEIRRMIKGGGGLVAYCGTNDLRELIRRAEAETAAAAESVAAEAESAETVKAVKGEEAKEAGASPSGCPEASSAGRIRTVLSGTSIDIGRPPASVVFEAMCRQIAQAVCAHGATLEGRIDAIIFTGGMAYSEALTDRLRALCGWMAPVEIVPGEREMEALAEGALRILSGEEEAKEYRK